MSLTYVYKAAPKAAKAGTMENVIASAVASALRKAGLRKAGPVSEMTQYVQAIRETSAPAPKPSSALDNANEIGRTNPVALVAGPIVKGSADAVNTEARRIARNNGGVNATPTVKDMILANRVVAARESAG